MEERLNEILRLDQPYSLPEVLKALLETSDVLLHDRCYDGHGWERLEYANRAGKEILAMLSSLLKGAEDKKNEEYGQGMADYFPSA